MHELKPTVNLVMLTEHSGHWCHVWHFPNSTVGGATQRRIENVPLWKNLLADWKSTGMWETTKFRWSHCPKIALRTSHVGQSHPETQAGGLTLELFLVHIRMADSVQGSVDWEDVCFVWEPKRGIQAPRTPCQKVITSLLLLQLQNLSVKLGHVLLHYQVPGICWDLCFSIRSVFFVCPGLWWSSRKSWDTDFHEVVISCCLSSVWITKGPNLVSKFCRSLIGTRITTSAFSFRIGGIKRIFGWIRVVFFKFRLHCGTRPRREKSQSQLLATCPLWSEQAKRRPGKENVSSPTMQQWQIPNSLRREIRQSIPNTSQCHLKTSLDRPVDSVHHCLLCSCLASKRH